MEQKRPADIFQEFLDYLWNGLGLEEKGWKRLKKGDFKKKMKNGLTYQVWFDRSRYNYIDYEIGYGNVEVGFSCIIKQGDDRLYSFKIEPTTGGSFFRMLTEDLRLNTRLLDTFLPLIKAHYLDFIDRFEVDPARSAPPLSSRGITAGASMCGNRWWNGTEQRNSWRSTAVRRNCSERRSTRQRTGWVRCCSTSPTPMMWIMPGPQASPKRNWTRWWNPLCGPSGRQDSGLRRMRRVISSTSRKQIRRNAPFGYGISLPIPGACRKSLSRKSWSSGGSCSRRRRRKPNEQSTFPAKPG